MSEPAAVTRLVLDAGLRACAGCKAHVTGLDDGEGMVHAGNCPEIAAIQAPLAERLDRALMLAQEWAAHGVDGDGDPKLAEMGVLLLVALGEGE